MDDQVDLKLSKLNQDLEKMNRLPGPTNVESTKKAKEAENLAK